ncbi:hypothetical protein C349_03925 [Cryptococcus neoformans var. grubii Br795]|nr:hypothetical protein C349_03925 [Cryptococcus neoformans var. grubii Br795]
MGSQPETGEEGGGSRGRLLLYYGSKSHAQL